MNTYFESKYSLNANQFDEQNKKKLTKRKGYQAQVNRISRCAKKKEVETNYDNIPFYLCMHGCAKENLCKSNKIVCGM